MNQLEISFVEPVSGISEVPKTWNVVQESHRAPETMVAVNSSDLSTQELQLIQALRRGEDAAFVTLIDRYHSRLLRLAKTFVSNQAVAEEVVQETWIGVLEGIKQFEGRSSLKTWVFKILTNRAKSIGMRESRYVSFADIGNPNDEEEATSVSSDHFPTSDRQANRWRKNNSDQNQMTPENRMLSKEYLGQLEKVIRALPPIQQKVIILADVEGTPGSDVCSMLNISENNRRVILHRARGKVRSFLEAYLKEHSTRTKTLTPIRASHPISVGTAVSF